MPTYDYECRSCRNRIEVIHPMSEDGPSTCERCGGPMRRLLHPAGIIFKGSGFYKTDSRPDASTGRSSTPAPDAAGTPSSPSTSTSEPAAQTSKPKDPPTGTTPSADSG